MATTRVSVEAEMSFYLLLLSSFFIILVVEEISGRANSRASLWLTGEETLRA